MNVNKTFENLTPSYLFAEVAARVAAYKAQHSESKAAAKRLRKGGPRA